MVTFETITFSDVSRNLTEHEMQQWIQSFWESDQKYSTYSLSAYFNLLQEERSRATRHHDSRFEDLSFGDLLTLRDVISAHHDATRAQLSKSAADALASRIPPLLLSDGSLQEAIKLVVRLFLLTKIEFGHSDLLPSYRQLPFLEGQSLRDSLRRLQTTPLLQAPDPLASFPLWFNVIDLQRITGLKIAWADYITDHLAIVNGTLYLFRNVQALKHLKGSKMLWTISTDRFFRKTFLEETITSVLLFFPTDTAHDYRTWLAADNGGRLHDWQQALVADYSQRPSPREVAEYPVWGQRLLRISEATRREGAWSIRRLWYDKRDESLWWTRWGLITAGSLALIFGLIQSITGIIQVVYAARSSPG